MAQGDSFQGGGEDCYHCDRCHRKSDSPTLQYPLAVSGINILSICGVVNGITEFGIPILTSFDTLIDDLPLCAQQFCHFFDFHTSGSGKERGAVMDSLMSRQLCLPSPLLHAVVSALDTVTQCSTGVSTVLP